MVTTALHAASTALTPPELAKILKVKPEKIHGFIDSGELAAVNMASAGSKRPRWRIMPEDVETFLQKRANKPLERQPIKRKKKLPPLTGRFSYLPD